MIIDKNLIFCEGEDIDAVSGAGGTTGIASTDVITVGNADFGYKGMFFIVKADEEIKTAKANGTVFFSIQASNDSTFSTANDLVTIANVAYKDFAKGAAIAKDTVIAKTMVRDTQGKKYLRAFFYNDGTWTKSDSQGSTMKVSAFITFDFPNQ